MSTLLYGSEVDAAFPNNTSQLITPNDMRDMNASNRTGSGVVTNTSIFTVPMDNGVPTAVNPLLPAPVLSGNLWAFDANNRAFPNYVAEIPGLSIPPGYEKQITVRFSMAVDKIGQGDDSYLFQLDNNGVAVGGGVIHTLTTEPTYMAFVTTFASALDVSILIGLTITPQGTNDDIQVDAFSMEVTDRQFWTAP